MTKGPQTVPAMTVPASMLSDHSGDLSLSSYVPDFGVFLDDCEVPSPSNLYGNSTMMDPPDYSLLSSGSFNDSYVYSQFAPPASPQDMFNDNMASATTMADKKSQYPPVAMMSSPAAVSTDSLPPETSYDYATRLSDFSASILYNEAEMTHLELFATSLVNGVAIKEEPTASSDEGGRKDNANDHRQLRLQLQQPVTAVTATVPATACVIKTEVIDDGDCCGAIGTVGGGGGTVATNGGEIETMQSMVLQQLVEDIEVACNALHISADPNKWTVDNVHSWLLWTLRQYNLPQMSLEYFIIDGPTLCSLSEDDFRQLTVLHGHILYAQLEIWKTAASFERERISSETTTTTASQPPPPPPQQQQQPNDNLLGFVPFTATTMQQQQQQQQRPIVDPSGWSLDDQQQSHSPAACVPDLGLTPNQCNSSSSDYSSDGGAQSDDEISLDGLDGSADKLAAAQTQLIRPSSSSSINKNNSSSSYGGNTSHSHIHLWQFLKELLLNPQPYSTCIRWLDRTKGVFKIEDSVRVARLWGKRKNRPAMNYDKLSRSIRQYYKKGIMKKTERSQRLVYQFCHPYCL